MSDNGPNGDIQNNSVQRDGWQDGESRKNIGLTVTQKNRLQSAFAVAKAQERAAFIPYVTAGDPDFDTSLKMLHSLVDAGADVIELGVPFSDPMADGPVIQRACDRALASGTSLARVLDLVSGFRRDNQRTPIVLMGYLNPIETMTYERFAQQAAAVGCDGVLVVDMPVEESASLVVLIHEQGLAWIPLVAPTTKAQRLKLLLAQASGFVYYVSVKGVTGQAQLDMADIQQHLLQIRQYSSLPVCVGFGVSDAQRAKILGRMADAVVVGSALVSCVETALPDRVAVIAKVSSLAREIRVALGN